MQISETNWRIRFWELWEDWEDRRVDTLTGIFDSPARYMRWAEQANADLGHFTPWEFAQEHGANSLMDYLYYVANRDYWNRACAEFLSRREGLAPRRA